MRKKTQQTKNKITAKVLLWTALGAWLVCAALRLVQMFTDIDADTGFFTTVNWSVYAVYGAVAAAVILLFALGAASRNIPASRPVFRKNTALLFTGLLFAVGLAMDGAMCIVQAVRAFTGSAGVSIGNILFAEGVLVTAFQALFAIFACVYFVLVALSYANEKASYCEYKLLALTPLFWALFRLVDRFMTKISFLQVSELVFELLLLCFMALFFLSFARVSSQVGQKGEMKKIVRYGLPAGFLGIFTGFTRLVCTVGGRGELVASGFAFSLADLAFGMFALAYIYVHMQYGRPASEDDGLSDGLTAAQGAEAAETQTAPQTPEV